MPVLHVPTKANPAVVIPALLIAGYLEHTAISPVVNRVFREGTKIEGKHAIRLVLEDGTIVIDDAAVQHLIALSRAGAYTHQPIVSLPQQTLSQHNSN